MKVIFLLGVFCFVAVSVLACPKSSYQYHVVDIPEPMLRSLGEFILKRLKPTRNGKVDTCYDDASMYLVGNNSTDDKFQALQMAGIFMYHSTHSKGKVFKGSDETERHLKTNCTYNILVSKNVQMRRFVLKNGTEGTVFEAFLTERQLHNKVSNEKEWEGVHTIECQHYLYHLSTAYRKNSISITLIDGQAGEMQGEFNRVAEVGGFVKQECQHDGEGSKSAA